MIIETERLRLVLLSIGEVQQNLTQMPPEVRAQISPEWLARLERTKEPDPWVHGFTITGGETRARIGQCGFKGPPGSEETVEIAYAIDEPYQGKGYATEAAVALTNFALAQSGVRKVIAHTLPEENASARVLTKCGFRNIGEVIDPEDGKVWRWEYQDSENRA